MIKPAVIKPVIAPAIAVPQPSPSPKPKQASITAKPSPSPITAKPSPAPITPVKSGGDTFDDDNDSDDETVSNDTFTPAENHKVFYLQAYRLLNAKDIVTLPDSTNICNTNPKLYDKLKSTYDQIHGEKIGL